MKPKENMVLKQIDLGNNSYFIGEEFHVGKDFKIGKNNTIRAKKFIAGESVSIGNNNNLLIGDLIEIGDCSYIGNNNEIVGIEIKLGSYLYFDSNIIIGHGGKMNYDSRIEIGDFCMVCSSVKLNINYQISIGDNVGIGEYVDIWTHGSFPDVLAGFPSQFGRVSIGNNVWLPAKTTVMPNVNIGNDIVFGANSVVNKNIPSGSLCAGMPAKVLKENYYPKILTKSEKVELIELALNEYNKLAEFKAIKFICDFEKSELKVHYQGVIFNFNNYTTTGDFNSLSEDLRDFLRRRGMKFFTGKPFVSIVPKIYKDLINFDLDV